MVAHKGESTAGELNTDLMASTGVEANAHQCVAIPAQRLELETGFFDALSFFFYHENFVFAAVFEQPVLPIAAVRGISVDKGNVFFDH